MTGSYWPGLHLPKLAFPEHKGGHHRHNIKEVAYCSGSFQLTGSCWPGLHLPKLPFPEHKGRHHRHTIQETAAIVAGAAR